MGNHCHLLPFSPVATQLKMSKAHLEIRQAKTSLGTHQDYEKQVPESRHCNMAYYCFPEYSFSFTRQSSLSFLPLPGFRMGRQSFSGQTWTEIQQPNTWQCFKTETPNYVKRLQLLYSLLIDWKIGVNFTSFLKNFSPSPLSSEIGAK